MAGLALALPVPSAKNKAKVVAMMVAAASEPIRIRDRFTAMRLLDEG
jgi:hypothetical protein